MNDDLSNVLNRFSEILKEKNIDINNIQNNNSTNTFDNHSSDNSTNSNDFSLDIDTIMKIKDVITKLNNSQNLPRNKLLESLKPYLENSKQEKLEKYIKIANLFTIIEDMDNGLSFIENKQGYDFILIITLFLLIL